MSVWLPTGEFAPAQVALRGQYLPGVKGRLIPVVVSRVIGRSMDAWQSLAFARDPGPWLYAGLRSTGDKGRCFLVRRRGSMLQPSHAASPHVPSPRPVVSCQCLHLPSVAHIGHAAVLRAR